MDSSVGGLLLGAEISCYFNHTKPPQDGFIEGFFLRVGSVEVTSMIVKLE